MKKIDMTIKNFQRELYMPALLAFILVLVGFTTRAQSFVLDLEANPMTFKNANKTILVNTGNSGQNEGSKHKYANVVTKDGITVYAIMTIVETHNAWITLFDDDAITGDAERFQPRIGTSGSNGGYILYQLEFFDTATDDEVFLTGYYMTGVDIDGGNPNSNREFVQVGGYSSYQVDATTQLTITTDAASGRTQFKGRAGSLNGVTFENTACFITNFTNPNNKITFALGQTYANSERYYSVRFGVPDGIFTNPNVTYNPLPIAIDDYGIPVNSNTGGSVVANILDNDVYEGNPIDPNTVNITLIAPAANGGVVLNTNTGEVTVAPGTPAGDYEMTYQICMISNPNNCDVANIYVTVLAADLAITKTVTPNPVEAGQAVLYTITVTNNGPSEATGVLVEDVLVNDLSFISAAPQSGTTWSAPQWIIGDLANGESVELTLIANVSESYSGDLSNTATVSSTSYDPNDNNNSAIATTTVSAATPIYNQYPATGPGTLAFEDLWPAKGDYDFNDLVIDYQFNITTSSANMVEQVTATFTIKAFGAALENGFGFQLSEAINPADLNVSGYSLTENYITLSGNGTEAGQTKPTIIVFDNDFNEMAHPGMGIGVNTTIEAPYVDPVTLVVEITFPANTYSLADLDIANFNPFLIVNQTRGHEVHLPNYAPTDLVDPSLFGLDDDVSNPTGGIYYKTANNLPWAINIYEQFDYPVEKQDIINVHLKFADWATSGGTAFPDWYKDEPGYRNEGLIYPVPVTK